MKIFEIENRALSSKFENLKFFADSLFGKLVFGHFKMSIFGFFEKRIFKKLQKLKNNIFLC